MKNCSDIFEKLKEFKKILVTGPQRSGTTICGHMIAKDLQYRYVDEREVNVRSLFLLSQKLLNPEKIVIQCPVASAFVSWIDFPETCVVFMRRNCKEIKESEERINWPEELVELKNYFTNKGPIAQVRYHNWDIYQRPCMKVPYFEMPYESLKTHPLWVDKEIRIKKFSRRQYALEPQP